MILSLTGQIRMYCIATNYSTMIRYTMLPPGDTSITYRFLCDELGPRLLHVWPLPTPLVRSTISNFWFAPLAIRLRPPTLRYPNPNLTSFPLHPSRSSNMLNLLHTSAAYGRSFPCRRKSSDAPWRVLIVPWDGHEHSVVRIQALREYRILRVSNSPHLCELCISLSIITQHLPLCIVSSFTKHPTCLEHRQVRLPTSS
ncbi:hypothetical protein B296_00018487 [Ensete ventricosum]|uniref:Uncharacterized protein n=1 Tax=Ensete ventricosum TaxID=4639 RepID=A0A426ZRW4_ENSVE|nr:hypothetical protein B296_00018487 [Ensete ventricosum]